MAAATEQKKGGGMARILLVEDDIAMSEMLAEILRTADHEVVTAWDGLQGRSIAMREQFDC